MGIKVKFEADGKIRERVVKQEAFGNFVMNIVRYKNDQYLVGEGDEYLRGYDQILTLGKKLERGN